MVIGDETNAPASPDPPSATKKGSSGYLCNFSPLQLDTKTKGFLTLY